MITKPHVQNTVGERLKTARMMAGIATRKEFFLKSKISPNTLQGWEQNKNRLSTKGAKRVVDALWKEGVMCSVDWLLYGRGIPPQVMENRFFNQKNKHEDIKNTVIDQQAIIAQEKKLFSELNANSIIFRIIDDAMSPMFEPDDLVGGIYLPLEQIENYYGHSCIVEFTHNDRKVITVRTLCKGMDDRSVTLAGLNSKAIHTTVNFYDVHLHGFAPIVWLRKTLE